MLYNEFWNNCHISQSQWVKVHFIEWKWLHFDSDYNFTGAEVYFRGSSWLYVSFGMDNGSEPSMQQDITGTKFHVVISGWSSI